MPELSVGDIRNILNQAASATGGAAASGIGHYKEATLVRNTHQTPIAHMAEELSIGLQGRLASAYMERRMHKPSVQPNSYVVPQSDMAEEMSMLVAGTKVTKKEEITGIEHTLRHEEERASFEFDLKTMLEAFVDLDDGQLEQFYQELLGSRLLTGNGLKEMLLQRFSDPSLQYVAALFCLNKADAELQMLKDQPNADLQWLGKLGQLSKLLKKELRWYEENYSRQIRASMNISKVVRDLVAKQRGLQGQELHQFYKDAVLDYTTLRNLYGMILKRFGLEKFKSAVDFLMKSLMADFDSQGPSIEKTKLKAIMDDIYQLHVLESIHLQCTEMYGQLTRMLSALPYSIEFLLEHLLAFQAGQQPGLLGVNQYLEALLFMDKALHARILLLNGTKKIIRLVPLKMYKDKKTKDGQLDSIQVLLDEYAQAEDEAEFESRR